MLFQFQFRMKSSFLVFDKNVKKNSWIWLSKLSTLAAIEKSSKRVQIWDCTKVLNIWLFHKKIWRVNVSKFMTFLNNKRLLTEKTRIELKNKMVTHLHSELMQQNGLIDWFVKNKIDLFLIWKVCFFFHGFWLAFISSSSFPTFAVRKSPSRQSLLLLFFRRAPAPKHTHTLSLSLSLF